MLNKISQYVSEVVYGRKISVGGQKARWTKVKNLKAGVKIAVASDRKLEFDEIVSIRRVGREQVYDIEVEGSRNFVGNGILAHNTTGKALTILNETGDQSPFTASVAGVTKFVIENDGDVVITGSGTTCTIGNGTGATNCTSDIRLKSNISDLGSSLDRINQLRPVSFVWSDPAKDQSLHTGLIAQEVQALFPEAVHPVYGDYLGIDYANLVVPVIKGLQEISTQYSVLNTQIASISAQLAQLKLNTSPQPSPIIGEGDPLAGEVWSYATASGKLTTIFPVQTADLTVVGKLSIGVLSIDDIDASISSLTGEITIKGDLAVTGSLKILGASAGRAVIPAGQLLISINSSLVSSTSAIFATPEKQPIPVSTESTQSGQFVLRIPTPLPSDLTVNWWVVN